MLPVLMLILVLGSVQAAAAEPWRLVRGERPIVIVAVHDGAEDLPGASERQQAHSADPKFNPRRDLHTAPIAEELARRLTREGPPQRPAPQPQGALRSQEAPQPQGALLGLEPPTLSDAGGASGGVDGPTLLVNAVHRRYVDLNRPVGLAAEEASAREYHHRFHAAVGAELERLLRLYPRVLLIDVHGQASYPYDLMIGTAQGAGVSDWSEGRLWGDPSGLVEGLSRLGYRVQPETGDQAQLFSGGYITQQYGADPRVEAWQFEHGRELRFDPELRQRYLEALTGLLNPWLEELEAEAHEPTPAD